MTGQPYVAARRQTPPPTAGHQDGNDTDDFAMISPPSVEDLLKPELQDACDRLTGDSIEHPDSWAGRWTQLDLPDDLSEPAVHELLIDVDSIDVHVAEQHEGGTVVCNVLTGATLLVEGTMSKGDATNAEESGLVDIIDFDFNRHYARVVLKQDLPVELEFESTVNPDAESVEYVTLNRAVVRKTT